MKIDYLQLTDEEIAVIEKLLDGIMNDADTAELAGFLRIATVIAHELPRRLRSAIYEFKLFESATALDRKSVV